MQDLSLFIIDLAASFMLAAAASCRARSGGAHFSGAAVLACIAGLAAPLVRDGLLGYGVLVLNRGEYLAAAVSGALCGALFARSRFSWQAFFWLDSLGLSLSAGLGSARGATLGLGATGSLVLGVVAALAGGLARDLCLGDVASPVEKDLYATAAALGATLALALLLGAGLPGWQCALAGAALCMVLRLTRRKENI